MIHSSIPWVARGYRENVAKRISSQGSIVESVENIYLENYSDDEGDDSRASTPVGAYRSSYRHPKRRVQSAKELRTHSYANSTFMLGPEWSGKPMNSAISVQLPRRPQSAQVPSKRPVSGTPKRRVKSASMAGRQARDYNKSYTMIVRSYEYGKFQSSINASPDARYFDRHSRCFDQNHLHSKLIWQRPQKSCQESVWCGPPTERDLREYSESQCVGPPRDENELEWDERQVRYVATMRPWARGVRPRTAPSTVRLFWYNVMSCMFNFNI